jgi:peptidoglycan pentaglycine glycine transferase (the first glycine)
MILLPFLIQWGRMQSLLQTKLWADFKATQGWRPHDVDGLSVLERDLPYGQSMFYAPEATVGGLAEKELSDLATKVRQLNPKAFLFRLEGFDRFSDQLKSRLFEAGYQKSFEETQPEHRQWIPITADEATIVANMREKGRYNTRLAERKGVTTRISTNASDVNVFYKIFKETASRDGFSIRSKQYFSDLCQALFAQQKGELVIAYFDGQPLVALIITYHDGLASYLYGASSNEHRNLMAPYAAHLAAIRSAKAHGCHTYDLLQIAPPDAKESHHYSKLTRFKQQLGGEAVQLIGGWDYVYSPLVYTGFKFMERLRRH